jgi:hypothetical protein
MSDVSRPQPAERAVLVKIERRHRQPDLCTFYEETSDDAEQMTHWMTAKGEAFVDLESSR